MPDKGEQAETIAFVTSPAAFGAPGDANVDRIDTHISVVALCGDRVLKLKRAVKFSFLDFSTAAKRKAACEAEVAVNRRTAPDIYLGVHAITREADGGLKLDGDGEAVDHVVAMRRFDQDGLLDRLAETGRLEAATVDDAVDTVARLHDRAEVRRDHGGEKGMAWVIDDNLSNLAAFAPEIFDSEAVDELSSRTRMAFARNKDLIERRRLDGQVRHGHGDLHLRNICLIDGRATLFDAIEFNDEFACGDVLYDLAFLIMDLLARDLPDLANRALNRYLWRTNAWRGMPPFRLFLSCRAAVRAKTSAISAKAETDQAKRLDFAKRAQSYLALATRLLDKETPRLLAIGGLSGTGKSTLAVGLAPCIGPAPGALVLRSDVLRKQLFGVALEEKLPQEAYTKQANEDVYERLFALALELLDAGWPVVADAVFGIEPERDAIESVARERSLPFTGFWLDAPVGQLVNRVTERRHDASDADAAVVRRQASYELGPIAWERIDASGTPDQTLALAKRMLAIKPMVVSPQQAP